MKLLLILLGVAAITAVAFWVEVWLDEHNNTDDDLGSK